MSTENQEIVQPAEPSGEPPVAAPTDGGRARYLWEQVKAFINFFWEIIKNIVYTLRATIFLFVNTLPVLLPSVVHTSSADTQYQQWLFKELETIVDELDLTPLQKRIIRENWISQMNWVENRATRERNANELIRWWQIILGVLIPVFIQIGLENVASVAGVFVAVITAVHQFRRPEDRWRHYRVLSERYQMEFWNYATLVQTEYAGQTHQEAFPEFNERMNELRREDLTKFFGEVVPASRGAQAQELAMRAQNLLTSGLAAEAQPALPGTAPASAPRRRPAADESEAAG